MTATLSAVPAPAASASPLTDAPTLTTPRGHVLATGLPGQTLRHLLHWAVRSQTLLRRVSLRGQDVSSMDLREAMLAEASLVNATCQWTNFAGANLRDADFRGADCRSAHFVGANLTGANFTGALLGGAVFEDRDGAGGLIDTTPDGPTILAAAASAPGVRLRIDD